MSDGSRFASLAQRARSLLGTGDVAVVALDAGAVTGSGGAGGARTDEDAAPPAPPAPAEQPPAPPPPPPPPAPAPEESEQDDITGNAATDEGRGDASARAAEHSRSIDAARAEERQRVADVFASDASKGKERAAASLLANPKLSADEIVALLPQISGGAGDNVMLANLSATPNPDLKPGAETNSGGGADVAAGWNRTFARLGWSEPKN